MKGLAEAPSLPTAPEVVKAIFDAVEVRINSLPTTKEKIREATVVYFLRHRLA